MISKDDAAVQDRLDVIFVCGQRILTVRRVRYFFGAKLAAYYLLVLDGRPGDMGDGRYRNPIHVPGFHCGRLHASILGLFFLILRNIISFTKIIRSFENFQIRDSVGCRQSKSSRSPLRMRNLHRA